MDKQRLIERFMRYCACGSESGQERDFALMIENELKELGLETWRDEIGEACNSNGFNVHGFLPGEGEPILFSAHLDTAVPGKTVTPILMDDRICSDGTSVLGGDDKSGIAAVMEALECLRESPRPHRPVEVFFSICEELGLLGAEHADYSKIRSKQAVVLDGSIPGCVMNQTAGIFRMRVEVRGKASHAALDPNSGVNALKAAAEMICRIPCGYQDGGDSVVNVANFHAPGEGNMVPDLVTFDVEIRAFSAELVDCRRDHALHVVEEICAATEGLSFCWKELMRTAILHVPTDSPLLRRVVKVLEEMDAPPELLKSFAGCDASHLDLNGIAAVDFGTGMQAIHSTEEYILVDDLVKTTHFVEGMMGPV